MEKPYHTTIIPKGTLLFRGVTSIADLTGDFAGILSINSTYCLYPNFNVFFYPYPFVAEIVRKYQYICIFVLTRDIQLINLIEPSPYVRSDRHGEKGGIISCDKIESACVEKGRAYDSCIDFNIVKDKSIVGMLGIPETDARSLKKLISKDSNTSKYYKKYYKLYKDAHHTIGIPEIVLYPRKEIEVQKKEQIEDFSTYIDNNKDNLNYIHFHVMEYDRLDLEELMDDLTSAAGFKGYHAAINKKTGFFQIIELSKKFDESHDLSEESEDFIYTTAKKEDYDIANKIKMERIIKKWVKGGNEDEYLELHDLDLINIPEMPRNVKYLSVWGNESLESLDNLPPNLIELRCPTNKIKSLGNLPKTLIKLNCSETLIENLDGIPDGLEFLYCNDCANISNISKLPSSLLYLELQNNLIGNLPKLPTKLQHLDIDNCQGIEELPKIPASLKLLSIKSTSITNIPKLPEGITLIYDDDEDEVNANYI
jgi:hypothetical protein